MKKRNTNCKFCVKCIYEYGTCVECCEDNMTEDEFEKYWTNNEDKCPYYEEIKIQSTLKQ